MRLSCPLLTSDLSPWAYLNLVYEKQCFTGRYLLIKNNFQIRTYLLCIQISIKDTMPASISFKIYKRNIIKIIFSKLTHRIGLTNLSGPPEYQRLTAPPIFPPL